ncbi:MAG: chemotaxis protein CheW [Spirochaetales bacterium]|nr:chemotaxis protein CheW [Spirochaetales bacterium]
MRITTLGELAHNLENLLDLMREGKLVADAETIDLLLSGIDYTRNMIEALRHGDISLYSSISIDEFVEQVNKQIRNIKNNLGEILLAQGKISEADLSAILRKQKELNYVKKFGEIAVEEKYISPEDLEESLQDQTKHAPKESDEKKQNESIIKVRASQINFLVDMVGELLITEAQLDESTQNLSQLKKITREIQYASMQLRTEKVKNLFIVVKRLVRDVSRKLKKPAIAHLKGEDLEIDRDLVEKLEEPLMHIIRNAIAHGIENESERIRLGKPAVGNIFIVAERRGNTIAISVEDDGRGLDRDKILHQALKKKLFGEADAARLSDFEIYNVIFEQGFSTADAVDSVSGRGVGMDIVKTVAASARGRVELKTEKGKYTRIEMIFPLSTAIIDGMIVKSKGTHFIIPVSNIIESLNMEEEKIFTVQNNIEVIDLRGEIIPVIAVEDYFAQDVAFTENGTGRLLAVIVENNEKKKYALLLDDIITKREVFIKSLGAKFRDLRGISSGTILQGGKIGFVLDID